VRHGIEAVVQLGAQALQCPGLGGFDPQLQAGCPFVSLRPVLVVSFVVGPPGGTLAGNQGDDGVLGNLRLSRFAVCHRIAVHRFEGTYVHYRRTYNCARGFP
jgi:hypothetical protein